MSTGEAPVATPSRLAYDPRVESTDAELLHAFRAAVDRKIGRGPGRDALKTEALRAEVVTRVADGVARARGLGLAGRVWLFGSFAWGTPRAESDVDLLLEGADDPFLAAAVIEAGIGREIDVVRIERAPAALRQRVLAQGKLL